MIYLYDGSFDGFLTVVFEIYASKQPPVQIMNERNRQLNMFDSMQEVITDVEKSGRVWNGLVSRSNTKVSRMFYLAFASELPGIEMKMFRYLEKLFADTTGNYHKNLIDKDSFELYNIARKVGKEIHRFHGSIRFQQTSDGLFFSAIEPDHDIVPLLAYHFSKRYAGQKWVIYDSKRDKGIYYDGKSVQEVRLTDKQFDRLTGKIDQAAKSEEEDLYRSLWKAYYKAINIPERKNTRLMLHFLPRRYWKYLPEKQ